MSEHRETPQERWSRKNGYTTKGFRMYKALADDFAEACKRAGVSQASVITRAMRSFIDEHGGDGGD